MSLSGARDYLSSVLRYEEPDKAFIWTLLLDGLVWLLAKFSGLAIADSVVFWILLGLALFVALGVFEAMRSVHARTEPDLEANIRGITKMPSPTGGPMLAIVVSVANQGAPTALTGWHGRVQDKEGDWYKLLTISLPNVETQLQKDNETIYLKPETELCT